MFVPYVCENHLAYFEINLIYYRWSFKTRLYINYFFFICITALPFQYDHFISIKSVKKNYLEADFVAQEMPLARLAAPYRSADTSPGSNIPKVASWKSTYEALIDGPTV